MAIRRKKPVVFVTGSPVKKGKTAEARAAAEAHAAVAVKADNAEETSAWREKMRRIREQCE